LAMLTRVAINCPPTVAWRAAWDNTSKPAQLICCATVLADYANILLVAVTIQHGYFVIIVKLHLKTH